MFKNEALGALFGVTVVLCGLFALGSPIPDSVHAQTPTIPAADGDAYAFETITVSTTAVGFTAATINPATAVPAAKSAFCSVETNALRYREDGTNPTSSVGHPKAAATEFAVTGINNLIHFRAIRSGGADATLSCTYFR